jgi:hypothetical protein
MHYKMHQMGSQAEHMEARYASGTMICRIFTMEVGGVGKKTSRPACWRVPLHRELKSLSIHMKSADCVVTQKVKSVTSPLHKE